MSLSFRRPDAYPVDTMTLHEVGGVTTMTILVQHSSNDERDVVRATGLGSGMQVAYDLLEDLMRADAWLDVVHPRPAGRPIGRRARR